MSEEFDAVKELCDILREGKVRVVFWVCPRDCQGRVEWSNNCTEAECKTCGAKRSEFTCPYCGMSGHDEDHHACPKRCQDAQRFVNEWANLNPHQ